MVIINLYLKTLSFKYLRNFKYLTSSTGFNCTHGNTSREHPLDTRMQSKLLNNP